MIADQASALMETVVRPATLTDAEMCGRICYEGFKARRVTRAPRLTTPPSTPPPRACAPCSNTQPSSASWRPSAVAASWASTS